MGCTACTEPQCLYKGDLYLLCHPFKAVSFSYKVTNINRDSSVSIVTILRAGARGVFFEFLEGKEFYLSKRPDPPIQFVLRALSTRVKQPAPESDNSFHVVIRLRRSGAVSLLSHTPSWHVQRLSLHYFIGVLISP